MTDHQIGAESKFAVLEMWLILILSPEIRGFSAMCGNDTFKR